MERLLICGSFTVLGLRESPKCCFVSLLPRTIVITTHYDRDCWGSGSQLKEA